jgi:mannose-6-phosphate isomerase-like protein (cupin superfamily)
MGADMSLVAPDYPERRYAGDTGEISAAMRRADARPDHESFGISFHYLATKASTDGDFGLFRVDLAPAGGGPGPHFHKTMSESFFVLSGTMSLFDGRSWFDSSAGDFLYVPPGGIHGFRNEADQPASILMLFAPGAPREAYFEGLADLAEKTDEERREFFIRHDNYYV